MSESTISAIAALLHLNTLSPRDCKRIAREGGCVVDENEVKNVAVRIRTAFDAERDGLRARLAAAEQRAGGYEQLLETTRGIAERAQKDFAAAEERAQRAERERNEPWYMSESAKALARVCAERDTARAHVETLKARVLAFCLNKMHRGWHEELKKLLEEGT